MNYIQNDLTLVGSLVMEMVYVGLEIEEGFPVALGLVKALMVANISLCQRQFHASLVSFTKVAIVQSLPTMTTKYTKCKKVIKKIKTRMSIVRKSRLLFN